MTYFNPEAEEIATALDDQLVRLLQTERQLSESWEAKDAGMTSYLTAECNDIEASIGRFIQVLPAIYPSHPLAVECPDLDHYMASVGLNRFSMPMN